MTTEDPSISLRVPQVLLGRADTLIPVIAGRLEVRALLGGIPTRSSVLRMALARGLVDLEEQPEGQQRAAQLRDLAERWRSTAVAWRRQAEAEGLPGTWTPAAGLDAAAGELEAVLRSWGGL